VKSGTYNVVVVTVTVSISCVQIMLNVNKLDKSEGRAYHHERKIVADARWDSGDGLTSGSHGSRLQQDDDPDSNMESSYTVAWDASRDLTRVSTTPPFVSPISP
jgi:hypothetical protein